MKFFGKELKFNNNKVYHAGDKPTPSEIGAAASSHGTHVTWATTAPKANGAAAVGTVARVAREDHVHPLQTTVSGNAGTATVWQNARTLTIGNAGKSVNGSANVSWSLNEIGAAKGKTISGTTAATAGWYRIATSPAGINRNLGTFVVEATVSGKHSVTKIVAGTCYGQNPTIQQLSHTAHSATGISKARIVYHTTYDSNYAYLEVYLPAATATTINVHMSDYYGWSLVTPSTAGSIPSGYSNKEITFVAGSIVSNVKGALSGNASTATKATQDSAGQQINTTYIKGLSVSGKTITYTKGDGTTGTITTQDNNTTYTAGTGMALSGTTFNHKNSVTAGTAQGDASKTLSWGGTFTIPTVTYDAQGHVTGKGTTTMTMPSNPNSDTKVTNTLNTTAKAYVTGTTSSSTNTGTQVFDTGVYLDTTAGMLTATTFKGALSGNATTATTLKTARTINGTSFNGSANITTANWGTARNITIGNTAKSVNGSANVSWSLAEIGAFSSGGGDLGGNLHLTKDNTGITGVCGGGTDRWGIIGGGTDDNGYLEINTKDNGNEPIYVRQYDANGLVRTAALLDGNGATSFPGKTSAPIFNIANSPGSQNNAIFGGSGDKADWNTHNLVIKSHWGIGFRDYQDICRIVFDTRNGNMNTRGVVYSEGGFSTTQGLAVNGHSTLSGGATINGGTLSGEIKFSGQSGYSDPWNGMGCAIKAAGNIAATGIIRANQYLQVGGTPLSIQSSAPGCGGVWIQI